jgi:phage host-nuclease inhibitor protein Gam
MSKVTMTEIIQSAEAYGEKIRTVRDIKELMDAEIELIKNKYSPKLIAACKEAGVAQQMVVTMLESKGGAEFFVKPRTLDIAGVTIGFRKQTGIISIPNEQGTIDMIESKLPDKAMMLLKNKITISKKALSTLTGDELKKIGVCIEADTDAPVVKIANDNKIQELIDATISETMVEVA